MLPIPPATYSGSEESQFRQSVQTELDRRLLRGVDLELANEERLILVSPDGSRFSITVANDGTLSAVAL